ncbi:MAG: antibiotic biosynthesis monooxygenase family protein [Ignavibacteriales bacterium]
MYLTIWEFHTKPGLNRSFEEAYGQNGIWDKLYKKDKEYLGTELLKCSEMNGHYVTIDRWTSEEAYRNFKERMRNEIKSIEERCSELSDHEAPLGGFMSPEFPSGYRIAS